MAGRVRPGDGRLDRLGERTVVTNQDLIGYRTPSVFESPARWRDYRQATRDALGLAAMVLFFSQTAADDALADDLVAPDRARVVALGARNEHLALAPAAAPPAGLAIDGERPFLLVLGTRYRHKNVRFALELLGALRAEQGWDGDLVIAGAEVLHGSGSGDDAAWLLGHPEHARHVHTRRRGDRAREGVAAARRGRRRLPEHLRGLRPDPVRSRRGGDAVPGRADLGAARHAAGGAALLCRGTRRPARRARSAC